MVVRTYAKHALEAIVGPLRPTGSPILVEADMRVTVEVDHYIWQRSCNGDLDDEEYSTQYGHINGHIYALCGPLTNSRYIMDEDGVTIIDHETGQVKFFNTPGDAHDWIYDQIEIRKSFS